MAKKILLVDDAPIVRTMLSDILVTMGYEIVGEAANGQEGVNLYKKLRPDLVTMDIVMPIKDGIKALEEILAEDVNAKVVMISAIDQREALMRAIKIGAVDFIIKPFENSRVISAIEKVLR